MSARRRATRPGSTSRWRSGVSSRAARRARAQLRRRLLVSVTVTAVGLGVVYAPALIGRRWDENPGPVASLPGDNPRLGLVYQGLEPAREGAPCVGAYELTDPEMCSHGPDEVPPGLDVGTDVQPVARTEPAPALPHRDTSVVPRERDILADAGATAPGEDTPALAPVTAATGAGFTTGAGGIACQGDGRDGNRVQVLYAYPVGTASRYSRYLASFRAWAAGVDAIVDASARDSGGSRHVRYVTTAECQIDVREVQVPAGASRDFDAMISALKRLGFDRTDRKYMIFADTNVYCGIGTFARDDITGDENRNNRGPSYGRTDAGCWSARVVAHELVHNLGGVQDTAPNASAAGHCVDDHDLMCHRDTKVTRVTVVCDDLGLEQRLDCGHDDYFSANPSSGSYLATHWNVASSDFLLDGSAAGGEQAAAPAAPASPSTAPTGTQPAGAAPPPTRAPAPGPSATANPGPDLGPGSGRGRGPDATRPDGPTATSPAAPGSAAPGTMAGAATQPPRPPSSSHRLVTGDTTATATRLGWPAAGRGTRYSVVVDGRSLGTTTATRVRVIGLRPGTAYQMHVSVRGADGRPRAHTGAVTVRTGRAAPPAADEWFDLRNALAPASAGVYGARGADGTPLVLGPADGTTDQQWRLRSAGAGRYLLRSRATGKCAAPNGTPVPGALVVQKPCLADAPAQHWRIAPNAYGFTLVAAGSSLVLGVSRLRFGGQRPLVLQRPGAVRYQSWSAMPA